MRIFTNYKELVKNGVYTCMQSLNIIDDMPFLNQSIILPYIHRTPTRSDVLKKIRYGLENFKPEINFNENNLDIYNPDFLELRRVIEKLPLDTFFRLLDFDKRTYNHINVLLDMFDCSYNTEKNILTLRHGVLPNFRLAGLFNRGYEKEEYESSLDFFSSLSNILGDHFELRTELDPSFMLDDDNLKLEATPKTCYLLNDEIYDCINFLKVRPFDIHSLCNSTKLEDSLTTKYSIIALEQLIYNS